MLQRVVLVRVVLEVRTQLHKVALGQPQVGDLGPGQLDEVGGVDRRDVLRDDEVADFFLVEHNREELGGGSGVRVYFVLVDLVQVLLGLGEEALPQQRAAHGRIRSPSSRSCRCRYGLRFSWRA